MRRLHEPSCAGSAHTAITSNSAAASVSYHSVSHDASPRGQVTNYPHRAFPILRYSGSLNTCVISVSSLSVQQQSVQAAIATVTRDQAAELLPLLSTATARAFAGEYAQSSLTDHHVSHTAEDLDIDMASPSRDDARNRIIRTQSTPSLLPRSSRHQPGNFFFRNKAAAVHDALLCQTDPHGRHQGFERALAGGSSFIGEGHGQDQGSMTGVSSKRRSSLLPHSPPPSDPILLGSSTLHHVDPLQPHAPLLHDFQHPPSVESEINHIGGREGDEEHNSTAAAVSEGHHSAQTDMEEGV